MLLVDEIEAVQVDMIGKAEHSMRQHIPTTDPIYEGCGEHSTRREFEKLHSLVSTQCSLETYGGLTHREVNLSCRTHAKRPGTRTWI